MMYDDVDPAFALRQMALAEKQKTEPLEKAQVKPTPAPEPSSEPIVESKPRKKSTPTPKKAPQVPTRPIQPRSDDDGLFARASRKKLTTRRPMTYTIRPDLVEELDDYCKTYDLVRSVVVERGIELAIAEMEEERMRLEQEG